MDCICGKKIEGDGLPLCPECLKDTRNVESLPKEPCAWCEKEAVLVRFGEVHICEACYESPHWYDVRYYKTNRRGKPVSLGHAPWDNTLYRIGLKDVFSAVETALAIRADEVEIVPMS